MIEIVHEIPEGIELSPHLKGRTDFYLLVSSFGVGYYIPATDKVRRLLGIDAKGKWIKRPPSERRWRWRTFDTADALRDIINALHAQVRDVELAEIETNVRRALLNRMEEALAPTIRRTIEQHTPPKLLTDEKKD